MNPHLSSVDGFNGWPKLFYSLYSDTLMLLLLIEPFCFITDQHTFLLRIWRNTSGLRMTQGSIICYKNKWASIWESRHSNGNIQVWTISALSVCRENWRGFHVIGQIVVIFSDSVTNDRYKFLYCTFWIPCLFFLFKFIPDLERRDLSHKEKLYLREQNVITETQCTLGKNSVFLISVDVIS